MSYVYRVIRAFGDIVRVECITHESTFGGKARGGEFFVTRKNGFFEMHTTQVPYDNHWLALLLEFSESDPTIRIGKF